MKSKLMSTDEIADILEVHSGTVRTYLGNWRFADYRSRMKYGKGVKDVYKFNRRFACLLTDYLYARGRENLVDKLVQYCERIWNGNK